MDRSMMNYPPGDPSLVDKIVCQLKSQGIFDRFRKECIADVDTKPAYQNLHQRVEGTVAGFLANQEWRPELNKNQLRDSLRKHVHESGFLDIGVERIVDQVVNPKILTVLLPQIEDVVYNFLGLEKPKKKFSQNVASLQAAKSFKPLKMETLEDLLPKDLDPISPGSVGVNSDEESEFDNVKKEAKDEIENEEERLGEDEDSSPPFEPIEKVSHNENSLDSHISGISGLTSHDSQMSNLSFGKAHPDEEAQSFQKAQDMDLSNHDSQLSKVSSGSRLSIVFSDDQQKAKRTSPASSDMDIQNEDSQISNIIEAVEPNPQNMQEFVTKEESKEFSHDFDCAATKELPSQSNDNFICERVNESSDSKVQSSADVDGSNLTFEIVEVPKEKELEDRDLEEKQTEKQDDLKHTFVSIDSHEPMHIEYTSHSSDCEQQKLEREKSSFKIFKVDGKDEDKDDVQLEKDQHENKLVENCERKDQEERMYPFSKAKNATEEKVVQSADVTKGYEQTEEKESEKQKEKYRVDACDVSKDKGKHDEKDVGKEKGKIDDKGDRGKSEKGLKESSKEKNKIDDKSEKDLSKRSHHNDKKIESTKDRCRNEEKEVYKEKSEKEGSKEEYKEKLEKEVSKEKPEKEGCKEKYEKGSKEKSEKVYKEKLEKEGTKEKLEKEGTKEKLEKEGTKEKSEKEGCKEKLEKEGSKDKSEKEGSKEKRHSDKANVIKEKIKNNDKEKQKDEKGERKTDEKFRKDPSKDKTKIEKNERESSRDRSKHDGKQDRNRSKHDRKDDKTKSDERSKRNDKDGGKEKMKRDGDTAKTEEGDEEKKNRNKDSRKEKIKEKTSRHDEKCKNEEKSKEQKYEIKENASKHDVKSPNEKSNRDSKSKTKVEVKEKDSKKEERIKDRSKDDKSDKERAEEKVEREKSRDERSSRHKRKEEKPREEKSDKENSKSDRSDRSKSRDERSEREKSKEEKSERSSKSSHEPKKNDRDSNKSRNNSSGSGDKAKNERKKDNKAKDDHSSHRERRPDDRRSADRDSNGHSASSSSSTHVTSSAASTHVSRRHDRRTTGRSGGEEAPADPEGNAPTDRTHDVHIHAHALPIKKRPVQSPEQARERKDNDKHLKRPKIAANIYEARKIMQQRKLERRRQREEERAASLPDDGDLALSSDGEELRFFEEAEARVDKVFLQFVKGLEESETLSELADSADEDALVSVGRLSPSSSLSEGLHVSTEPTGDTLSGSEIHDAFGRSPARESRSGTPSIGPSPPKRFISQSAGYKGDVDDGPRIRIQPSSGDRQERRKRDHHHMRRFMISRESRSTKGGFATASEGDDSSGSTHFTPPDVGAVLGVDSGLNVGTSKARNQLAAEVAPLRGRPPKRRGTSASPAPSPSPSPAPSAVSVSAPTPGEAVPKRPTLASDVVGGIVAPEEAPRVGSDPPTPSSRLLCPRSTPPLQGLRKPLPHTKTHSPGIISYGGFIPKEIVEVKVLDVSGEAEDVKENNVDKSSSDDEKGSGEDTLSNELISSALRDLMMESGLNLGASVAVAAPSEHEDGGVDSSTTSATDVHAPASTPTHEAGPSPDQSPAMDDAGPGRRAKIGRGRRLGLPRPLRRLSGQSSPLTGSNKEGTPSSPDCDTSSTPPPQDSKGKPRRLPAR